MWKAAEIHLLSLSICEDGNSENTGILYAIYLVIQVICQYCQGPDW